MSELAQDRPRSAWKISPYGWALSLEGEAGIEDVVADIDIDFSDAITESDTLIAGMLWGAIEYDDLSLFVSDTYVRLGIDDGGGTLGAVEISSEVDAELSWLEVGLQKELGVTGKADGGEGIV